VKIAAESTDQISAQEGSVPLCLDLDGTLIRSDILVESALQLVRTSPGQAARIPLWLLKGKAYLKNQIAKFSDLRVDLLPYNQEVVELAHAVRKQGRPVVLATASNQKYANQIAEHLELFDGVHASDEQVNLSSSNKARFLVNTYGDHEFDYAGNSKKDLEVWQHSRQVLVVEPESGVISALKKTGWKFELLNSRKSGPGSLLSALRPYQWLKNALVLVPLMTAHLYTDIPSIYSSILAVMSFCLMASAGYLINDLFDLEADRLHPRKRNRPFASGDLSILVGLITIPLLVIGSLLVSSTLPLTFFWVICCYFVVTLSYSLFLKRKPVLDVFVLAGLYTLRVIGGTAALGLEWSFWLLAFSMFLFLSLAFVKRFAELKALELVGKTSAAGRGYGVGELELVRSLGVSAGYGAVVVMALYVNSPEITVLYKHPEIIWLICPILLYWLARTWTIAHHGMMHDDPLIFAIEDRVSQLSLLLCLLIVWLAV
jgi:4-hydroxybenzoate polyprenyltransferase/phosphoserine phosphatase